MTQPFVRIGGVLSAESVALTAIAESCGTPAYVYSAASFRSRFGSLRDAFRDALPGLEPLVAFSVKACPSLAILALLAREGAGFDVVSGGELRRVIRAGGGPNRTIFAGVGKTDEELDLAVDREVLQVNVESAPELARLDAIAVRRGQRARAALRVNPGVDPRTHPHLATSAPESKFGLSVEDARSVLRDASRLAAVDLVGLHVHLGSMLRDANLWTEALDRIAPLVDLFPGGKLGTIDIGGGLAVRVGDDPDLAPGALAGALAPRLRSLGARPILEPGRWIAAPSGLLLTRVLHEKRAGGRRIVVVDAGMNDLLRPALYDAPHDVEPVIDPGVASMEPADVAGPVCESGDFLARGVRLPPLAPRDLLAVRDAGAYGFSMASNYNSRPRPPEILVDGARHRTIRDRETFDDLVRGERV